MAQRNGSTDVTKITKEVNYLRITTLLAILWFVLIFNVEEIRLPGEISLIKLNTVSYVSLIAMGLLTLAFPNIVQLNFLTIFVPIVTVQELYYVLVWHESINFARLFYDGFALAVTLLLLRRLGRYLLKAEDTLSDFVLTDVTAHILPYAAARQKVSEAFEELQQIGSPMAFIYCRVYSNHTPPDNQATLDEVLSSELNANFVARYLQVRLARFITGITYTTDIVFEHGHAIAVCLPQTDHEDARKFLHQLNGFIRKSDGFTLWTSITMFPADGKTLDDLLLHAKYHLKLYVPDTDMQDDVSRTGDVAVSIRERVLLEQKSQWVNKLAFQSPTSRAIYRPVKRLMDIVAAGTALIMLLPILLAISVAILIDDGWPIFFSHKRVGLGGKTFMMHKFRSMYRNAPPLEPKIVTLSDGTIRYDWPDKDEDDPRVTRIGRLLRKTSLDELPQLWNVLAGSMSLIGPRPSSWTLEQHTLHQTARLTVKPGLTGLWQVSARDSKNFDERLLWDLKYVEKMGLWLDIQILIRTVRAVLNRSGV